MEKLVEGLAPAFASGFAVQQLLEILDPLLGKIKDEKAKKLFLSVISLAAGLILSFFAGLRVLEPLGVRAGIFDPIVTGLIISAGTEGFNSVMKFLGYSKDKEKSDAAMKKKDVMKDSDATVVRSAM